MRITLTIKCDAAALLQRLREGLKQIQVQSRPQRRHRTAVVSLGSCLPGNLDDVTEALATAEGETFR